MYVIIAMVWVTGDKFPAECCDTPEHPQSIKLYHSRTEAIQASLDYNKKYPKCRFHIHDLTGEN